MKAKACAIAFVSAMAGAACGGKAKAPGPSGRAPGGAGGVPAAHYAALFQDGKAWTYASTSTSSMLDPDDPKAGPDGNVEEKSSSRSTCKVRGVRRYDGGVISTIACEPPVVGNQDPVAGTWVADARGLYHLDEEPAAGAPDLSDAHMVIAATPKPGKTERKGTGEEEGFGESTEIKLDGAAWCATWAVWGGDESYSTVCLGSEGIVKGAAGWAGGSVHDTTFELVR